MSDIAPGDGVPDEVREGLEVILEPEAVVIWWRHTSIPALGGRTPKQAWEEGDSQEVLACIDRYASGAYS